MTNKIITVGVPAFHALDHISGVLSSVNIQTIREQITVIISNDDPFDNGKYDFLKSHYPELDIVILDCEKNGGPGIARQRALDACKTPWITFIDSDDVFMTPTSLEVLRNGITQNCIEVMGTFFQQVITPEGNTMFSPRNDVGHPWVFGRLYNVQFLKDNNLRFSSLRAMEDGELNWKIRMLIEGTPLQLNVVNDAVYLWRTGSEHSITRIGVEENGGIPLYNFDLCPVGATAAAIRAIKFCKKGNPFNGNITKFTVEYMIGQYFSYVECCAQKPMFEKQSMFNAKRFYHEVYKEIENQISEEVLKNMYTMQNAASAQNLIGIIPSITFFDFMKQIKTEPFGGKEEFDAIRAELPEWVIKLDLKSGVLGEDEYISTEE